MTSGQLPNELLVEADGGSRGNPGPAGYGAVVRDPASNRLLAERAEFLGTATNNVAEYRGLIAGLRAAAAINPDARVTVRMDSKLVVEQMSGRWKIKHPDMQKLAAEARNVLPQERVTYTWIPRAENAAADDLANRAMDGGVGTEIVHDYPPNGNYPPSADKAPTADQAANAGYLPGLAPAPDEPEVSPDSACFVALVAAGGAPWSGLRQLGTGAWADVPAPSWVVSAPSDHAKETARSIASGLGVPSQARSLEPAFAEPTDAPAAARALALEHLDKTIAVAASREVIAAVVGSSLEMPRHSWASLALSPGSLTILRYRAPDVVELLAFGVRD